MDAPAPRSLILDLLSTLRRGTMPVGALLEAGSLFGLAGGTIRVALARLVASGRVERDERGCYRLGAKAAPLQATVGRWRELDTRTIAWAGDWWGVQTGEAPPRHARGAHEQSLRLHGFRVLAPHLQVRPANLAGGCEAVRDSLRSLGLSPGALVFRLDTLDSETDAKARALWDTDALGAGYRDSLASLAESTHRLRELPEADAMRESFLQGGRVLQQLVLDPWLPDEIQDSADRRALLDAMRAYDRLGRDAWSGLLARFGVPHRGAPADAGFADRIARLTAA